jgi:hypothetical protein
MLLGQPGNTLVLLLAILVVVFCIFTFLHLAYSLTNENTAAANQSYYEGILAWFRMPASLPLLGSRPWTIFTFMFIHDGVWNLIGNLIWMWVFGFILQDLTGNKTIIPLFIYSSLAGALLYLISMNVFPGLKSFVTTEIIEGASAGVMGIAIATTLLAPGYRFFPMINGGIPLWVITAIYVVIDLAMIANLNAVGSHISHLGGGLFGWIFMSQLQKGNDWSLGLSRFFDWFNNLFSPDEKDNSAQSKAVLYYAKGNTEPYKKIPQLTQKKIDAILDKIGEKGYDKLTDEEKDFLKKAAEGDKN